MTWWGLLGRNLRYHWRGNLAVVLGVAVGAAVLTGALLVGDSLRGSLRDRVERQLGWVDATMITDRFFRGKLAEALPGTSAPAVLLRGSVRTDPEDAASLADLRLAGGVTVLGVDERFWPSSAAPSVSGQPDYWQGKSETVVLSRPLAETLDVEVGDRLSLNVGRTSAIPRSSLLGRRDLSDTTSRITVEVGAILPADHPANDFSLFPNPRTPLNLFAPLGLLQERFEKPDRVNALLAGGAAFDAFGTALQEAVTLDDWGLRLVPHHSAAGRYLALESEQLLLGAAVADAAMRVAEKLELRTAPTLVYLANWITQGREPPGDRPGRNVKAIPYSIVAALNPAKSPPLGPFLPVGVDQLNKGEIVLVDWPDTPLTAKPGDPITLTYFEPEIEGQARERSHTLTLKGFIPLKGVAEDPDLTPPFPGITDKLGLRDWDPPFPYDDQRIQRRDDAYWEKHKTTPKAYITLAEGQELWGSRFGELTSIRLAPAKDDQALEAVQKEFRGRLRDTLPLAAGGFTLDPVRQRLLAASQGSNDFDVLFLGFSFFLIAAALLLVGLLVRLNLDRRAYEMGLLTATGFSVSSVRRLLLLEGLAVSGVGIVLGLLGAVGYAAGMLELFVALWPRDQLGSGFALHARPVSFVIGAVATLAMSLGAILWAIRGLSRVKPSQLLHGETTAAPTTANPAPGRWSGRLLWIGLLGAVGLALAGPMVRDPMARAGTFMGSGALLLVAGLAGLWNWLRRPNREVIHGHGAPALAQLGSRNASRNPTRSLLTAALLASAAFLLVAVEAFRREPEADFLQKTGGSGGFPLVAESDIAIFQLLDTSAGQNDFLEGVERAYQNLPEGGQRLQEAETLMEQIRLYPLRLKAGDDASCLNLYQATRPRVLGASDALIERGGFRFAASLADTEAAQANPWRLLHQAEEGEAIPIMVEQNTAQWMLKKGLGDTIEVPDGDGVSRTLRIVGLLQDSVFQSEVVMAEEAFEQLYPREEGYAYFLIEAPEDQLEQVGSLLELGYAPQGLDVTTSRSRVADYLEAQNTYLTTFQLLGGFGLMLGVLGLGVVLLRNIWERRAELALLRCLGYRTRALNAMILAENTLLLLLGLGVGVVAAFVAVAPHLLGEQSVPWLRLVLLLGGVVLIGLMVVAVTVVRSVQVPVLTALRRE